MKLNEWRQKSGLTWQKVCNMLSETAREHDDEPIYYNRIVRLRGGKAPRSSELRALLKLTKNECDSFRD